MKKYLKFAPWVMVGFAVLALLMLFAPQLVTDGDGEMSGVDVIFGYEIYGEELLQFSFMNLVTYLLLVAMAIFAVASYIKEDKKLLIIAIALSFLTMIFFFMTKTFVVPVEGVKELIREYCSLGVGAIFGAIFSMLAGGVGIAKLALDKE